MTTPHGIFRIETYREVVDLFRDYGWPYEEPTEDQRWFYMAIYDYEPVIFHVVNNDTVYTCDRINGDVISCVTLDDFLELHREAYGNNRNE